MKNLERILSTISGAAGGVFAAGVYENLVGLDDPEKILGMAGSIFGAALISYAIGDSLIPKLLQDKPEYIPDLSTPKGTYNPQMPWEEKAGYSERTTMKKYRGS